MGIMCGEKQARLCVHQPSTTRHQLVRGCVTGEHRADDWYGSEVTGTEAEPEGTSNV